MMEFLQSYGLWIVLAVVFIAMHRFGVGCCGAGHRHAASDKEHGSGTAGEGEVSGLAPRSSKGSCH